MSEEVEYLREHLKEICQYKGLQEELTYDVPLAILKRTCIALDYLQQENKQLKKALETTHEDRRTMQIISLEKDKKIEQAINYIDQVIMYKPCAREIDKELNTLIGILRGENNE